MIPAVITIGIDPVIFELGPFAVRWYGVFIALAAATGFSMWGRKAVLKGFDMVDVLRGVVFMLIGGLIGARLFHIVDNLSFYLENPGRLFQLQVIGLAVYGGVAGGALALFIYCRVRKLPFLRLLDCGALAMPTAQLVGKFANLINGDTWGSPTGLPWGLVYTHPNTLLPESLLGVPTHPAPIYEQLWLLVVIGVVWWARKHLKVDGQAFMLYVMMYSVGRFIITFFRVNNPILLGLKEAQVIALAAIVVLLPLFIYLQRRGPKAAPPPVAYPAKKTSAATAVTSSGGSPSKRSSGKKKQQSKPQRRKK